MSKYTYIYHATDCTIDTFNLNHLHGGEHNFGPGIYFSTQSNNIDFYLNEDPDGRIYKTKINLDGQVNWYDLITDGEVKSMFESFPFKLEKELKKDFFIKYKNKNYLYIFDNLPYEIWKIDNINHEVILKNFLLKMSEKTGITSMFAQNGTFRDEVVVFNPSCLEIVEIIKK